MKTTFYLIINENGTVRTNKNKPALAQNEVSILQSIELPDSIFKKPQLQASIIVSETDMPPRIITPEIQDNIKAAIEQAAGVEVKLIVEPQDLY